jgi:aspartyl-tRNA(Asn)/glutamyl-tRNA(Gln) amidotransferase subunit C
MQVNDELLTKLEKLSHLKISEDKREEVIKQLGEIVSFVDNLTELNTDGVDATFSMDNSGTRLREDVPSCNTAINDVIIANAPHSEDHFFIVPKIIE